MNAVDVEKIVQTEIEGSKAIAEGEGCSFQLTVISEQFADKSAVKKQQLVYACLQDLISSGEIHAVQIKTFTPQQWQDKQPA